MTESKWKASAELLRRFRNVGRALLLYDIEDSHSGNIAMRWQDPESGREKLVITGEWARRPIHILDLANRSATRGRAIKARYK